MSVTAIILAGGRSSRFGSDKLAASLDDGTVLAATIRAVAPLADAVVVAGPNAPDLAAVPDALPGLRANSMPLIVVRDVEPFGGPLAALANVLEHGMPDSGDVAIVVGGDMPRLVTSVLVRMLDVLDVDPTVDAVYLGRPEAGALAPSATSSAEPSAVSTAEPSAASTAVPSLVRAGQPVAATAAGPSAPPRRQVLPLAIRVQPATRAARVAVQAGRRSLRALVDEIAAIELPPSAWLPLDPGASTLVDVDTRADLDRLR